MFVENSFLWLRKSNYLLLIADERIAESMMYNSLASAYSVYGEYTQYSAYEDNIAFK